MQSSALQVYFNKWRQFPHSWLTVIPAVLFASVLVHRQPSASPSPHSQIKKLWWKYFPGALLLFVHLPYASDAFRLQNEKRPHQEMACVCSAFPFNSRSVFQPSLTAPGWRNIITSLAYISPTSTSLSLSLQVILLFSSLTRLALGDTTPSEWVIKGEICMHECGLFYLCARLLYSTAALYFLHTVSLRSSQTVLASHWMA